MFPIFVMLSFLLISGSMQVKFIFELMICLVTVILIFYENFPSQFAPIPLSSPHEWL